MLAEPRRREVLRLVAERAGVVFAGERDRRRIVSTMTRPLAVGSDAGQERGMRHVTPLGAVARGLIAGAVGTAVMTGWQELSMKLQGPGDSGQGDQAPEDPWEQASTPAKVGRRVLEGVFGVDVPAARIGLLTNAMHWGYGITWGAAFGVLQGTVNGPALRTGLLFGSGVWAMSYVQLVPMGLYEPPWKYPPRELALDLSYHLAYGAGLGVAYAAIDD